MTTIFDVSELGLYHLCRARVKTEKNLTTDENRQADASRDNITCRLLGDYSYIFVPLGNEMLE